MARPSNTLTLPRLGIINMPLKVAPFQIPNSVSGYSNPYFINGSSFLPNAGSVNVFGGYFGLNYIYTNNQLSTRPDIIQSDGQFSIGYLREFAGGVVQSFGIYDYISSQSPTFTKPYYGGDTQRYDRMCISQGPNIISAWSSQGVVPYNNYISTLNIVNAYVPNIAFSNYHGNLNGGTTQLLFGTTTLINGGATPSPQPYYRDPFSSQYVLPPPINIYNVDVGNVNITVSNFCCPATYSHGLFATPYFVNPTLAPGLSPVSPGASNTRGGSLTGTVCAFSPKYNTYLSRFDDSLHNLGVGYCYAFTTDSTLGNNADIFLTMFQPIQLQDPTDDTDLDTTNFNFNGGFFTVTPSGDFLCSPINGGPSNGLSYYLISGNGLGYYKINFQGVSSRPGAANTGGFGVDTNGNFWAFYGNTLYSNLNLGASLTLATFPNVSLGAVGCRRNQCAWPWYG